MQLIHFLSGHPAPKYYNNGSVRKCIEVADPADTISGMERLILTDHEDGKEAQNLRIAVKGLMSPQLLAMVSLHFRTWGKFLPAPRLNKPEKHRKTGIFKKIC